MNLTFWAEAARWALIAIFAAAAFTKLVRRSPRAEQAGELVALGIPTRLAPALVVALPLVELLLAAALVFVAGSWPVLLAVVFLAFATLVLIRAVARGVRTPCRCFGSFSNRPVSPVTLIRNAVMLVIAGVAWWAPEAVGVHPVAGVIGIGVGFALMYLG